MDITAIYESVLTNVQTELLTYGYTRSGKSTLFYRYSADKKVGCCIEMQKSMFNSPDSYSFTFNLLCIGSYELRGYRDRSLTVSVLKSCFSNPFVSKRIGTICRGGDYWWEITPEILEYVDPEEYYDRYIRNDIKAAAAYLDELSEKKQSKYTQNTASAD